MSFLSERDRHRINGLFQAINDGRASDEVYRELDSKPETAPEVYRANEEMMLDAKRVLLQIPKVENVWILQFDASLQFWIPGLRVLLYKNPNTGRKQTIKVHLEETKEDLNEFLEGLKKARRLDNKSLDKLLTQNGYITMTADKRPEDFKADFQRKLAEYRKKQAEQRK